MPFGAENTKPRSTEATVAERVQQVILWRLAARPHHKMLAFAKELGWDICHGTLQSYVRKADDLIEETQRQKRRRLIAVHLARRESLLESAIEAGDRRTALAIMSDLADIQCLYMSERELKEMQKTFAAQEERIKFLEGQLREKTSADRTADQPPAPATGPSGTGPDEVAGPAIVTS